MAEAVSDFEAEMSGAETHRSLEGAARNFWENGAAQHSALSLLMPFSENRRLPWKRGTGRPSESGSISLHPRSVFATSSSMRWLAAHSFPTMADSRTYLRFSL